MNAARIGALQGFASAFNVCFGSPGQSTDSAVLDAVSNRFNGLEVAIRGGGESCFDNIYAHALELTCDADLLFLSHGRARTLLSIA